MFLTPSGHISIKNHVLLTTNLNFHKIKQTTNPSLAVSCFFSFSALQIRDRKSGISKLEMGKYYWRLDILNLYISKFCHWESGDSKANSKKANFQVQTQKLLFS